MKDYKDFYILKTKEEFILWLMGIIYVILISCVIHYEVFLKEDLVKIEKKVEKEYFAKLEKQKMEQAKQEEEKKLAEINKKKENLTEDDRFYNSAEKEYIEGTYTTFVRFLRETGIPNLQMLQTMYMNWKNLSEYEKSNVKKATMEIMLTSVILPLLGMLMAGIDDDDDDNNLLWFFTTNGFQLIFFFVGY